LIRGFVYGACIYVATLIIMPTSALGLTPPQMVLASIGVGLGLSLFVTRHDYR
jgi:hypothetical protein